MEIDVKGHRYRTGRLNAMQQFHISRRLAPVFAVMGAEVVALARAPAEGDETKQLARFVSIFPAVSEVLSKMTDDDSNYVIHNCLGACLREVSTGQWQTVIAKGGAFMFDDMELDEMMQLVVAVLRDNLSGFLKGRGGSTSSPSS